MHHSRFYEIVFILLVGMRYVLCASFNRYSKHLKQSRAEFYPFLATRTAYELVHGNISRPNSDFCTPVQMWGLVRHGTRYPSKDVLPKMLNLANVKDEIIKNHENGSGNLSWEKLQNLRLWQPDPNMNEKMAQILTSQGYKDHTNLAKRLQHAYPELLVVHADEIDARHYIFRSTNTQRTRASMEAFIFGLFNDASAVKPVQLPEPDNLLRPHSQCPAWKAENNRGNINNERDKFTAGPEMHQVLKNVSKKLGFASTMKFADLKPMYEMCRFETAWHVKDESVWCSIFSKEDLKVLEYREDINYYHYSGPGRQLSIKLGCPILSDMFDNFRKLNGVDSVDQPKAEFSFAHTLSLQSLTSALGIGKESKPLMASDFATAGNRKFRISLLDPFATNVVAVFYRCDKEETPNKVAMFVSEKLIVIPGCKDVLCNWETLEQQYGSFVDDCNLDFCYEDNPEKLMQ